VQLREFKMADIRLQDKAIDDYLDKVGELSDEQLARVGIARAVWNAWAPRQKLLKLVEIGMLKLQEIQGED